MAEVDAGGDRDEQLGHISAGMGGSNSWEAPGPSTTSQSDIPPSAGPGPVLRISSIERQVVPAPGSSVLHQLQSLYNALAGATEERGPAQPHEPQRDDQHQPAPPALNHTLQIIRKAMDLAALHLGADQPANISTMFEPDLHPPATTSAQTLHSSTGTHPQPALALPASPGFASSMAGALLAQGTTDDATAGVWTPQPHTGLATPGRYPTTANPQRPLGSPNVTNAPGTHRTQFAALPPIPPRSLPLASQAAFSQPAVTPPPPTRDSEHSAVWLGGERVPSIGLQPQRAPASLTAATPAVPPAVPAGRPRPARSWLQRWLCIRAD
ncbi:hypothetical protein V8C86DRAFT_2696400 [Haematococcus lacustris]